MSIKITFDKNDLSTRESSKTVCHRTVTILSDEGKVEMIRYFYLYLDELDHSFALTLAFKKRKSSETFELALDECVSILHSEILIGSGAGSVPSPYPFN